MLSVSWPLLGTVNAADPIPVGRNDADGDSIVNTADVDDDNDGIADLQEIGADGSDRDSDRDGMPDRLDLDSDNDGIQDIIELGGSDSDNNGHVDNFVDVLGGKDGTDDGLLVFPYNPRDVNGNGVFDHVEYVPSGDAADDGEAFDVVPDAVGLQPQADDPQPADEASQGVILTGLNASGCSITSSASNSLLYLLTIISIAMLGRRYTLRRRSTPNKESKIAP